MVGIGLDLGTGFVKCVSDYGYTKFPSLYIKQIHGAWTSHITEAVGYKAIQMMNNIGASAILPISMGKPDARYFKQTILLIREAINKVQSIRKQATTDKEFKIAVGLPYYAHTGKKTISRLVKNSYNVSKCVVIPQAAGTLVDMNKSSGIVVSIGQGTTEIVIIDKYKVLDGNSSNWASSFITKKISKLAHLDTSIILEHKNLCKKYAKILAENLAREILDVSENYANEYQVILSGGGILIPGVKDSLLPKLGKLTISIPNDPVMSNARGLHKLVLSDL